MIYPFIYASIHLSIHPSILHPLLSNTLCIWFSRLILFYGGVICTPPPALPSCPGLGPALVPFFGSCGEVFGCATAHEAKIPIQISTMAGISTSDLGSLMATNVTTRLPCSPFTEMSQRFCVVSRVSHFPTKSLAISHRYIQCRPRSRIRTATWLSLSWFTLSLKYVIHLNFCSQVSWNSSLRLPQVW